MRSSSFAVALVLAGLTVSPVRAGDRSAEAILKEIDAVKMPQLDPSKTQDREYVNEYLIQWGEALQKRNPLILELFQSHPENDRLPDLMVDRWQSMSPLGDAETLKKELDQAVKSDNAKLRTEARFFQVRQAVIENRNNPSAALPAVEKFLMAEPKDPRGVMLLYSLSQRFKGDEKAALEKRVLEEYPDSGQAKMVLALRKREEAVGKPVELEFTDAISGGTVSMKDLKGKVVVLDFWATWCGPCVGEMPHMKELYAKYKDQGVEFIGVSLDQPKEDGGLDALKEFVKKNEIAWPQYYQGNGWESEFSRSWAINSIPTMFVVDPDGNLYSVEARGKLETMIPELLGKGKKKPDEGE